MRTKRSVLLAVAVLTVVAALSSACRGSGVRFIPEGGPMTVSEAEETARGQDVSRYREMPVEEASQAREQALTDLRREGDLGREAADLLSKDFPEPARSVPVLVELADLDGKASWVVVEAWGTPGGKLDSKRLWVFDRSSGQVTRSASYH